MIVTIKGKQAQEVKSLEEAIKVAANHRDTADHGSPIGATEYYRQGTGRVFEQFEKTNPNPKPYAQIHYNGRVEFLHPVYVEYITDGDGITRHLSRPVRLL